MCQSQGAHVRLMIDNLEPHCKLELQNNDTKEENISLKLKKTRLRYARYQGWAGRSFFQRGGTGRGEKAKALMRPNRLEYDLTIH